LAEKEIEFCNLCEKCASNECVLEDDFNQIYEKMQEVVIGIRYMTTSEEKNLDLRRIVVIRAK
jgi:hypothetical protein